MAVVAAGVKKVLHGGGRSQTLERVLGDMGAVFILVRVADFLTTRDALCAVAPTSSEVRSEVIAHVDVVKINRVSNPAIGALVATLVTACRQLTTLDLL